MEDLPLNFDTKLYVGASIVIVVVYSIILDVMTISTRLYSIPWMILYILYANALIVVPTAICLKMDDSDRKLYVKKLIKVSRTIFLSTLLFVNIGSLIGLFWDLRITVLWLLIILFTLVIGIIACVIVTITKKASDFVLSFISIFLILFSYYMFAFVAII